MKRIIEGKRYDTETAVKIAYWCNGLGDRDFNNCEEALYRTKNGKYFIHGAGGPMSRWAHSCGNNSYSGGSGIEALSPTEALEWIERHDLEVDERTPELLELVTEA